MNTHLVRLHARPTPTVRGLAPPHPRHARVGAHRVAAALGAPVDTRLTLGAPDDAHEREADAVADRVMRMPAPGAGPGEPVRRMCAECEEEDALRRQADGEQEEEELQRQSAEEEEEPIQAKAGNTGAPDEIGADTAARIRSARGGGRPLPGGERGFFGPRLGADLGQVRVHDDGAAAELNRRLGARAFTVGSDVFFARGEYRPGTTAGRHLIAHELAHVLQQRGGDMAIRRQSIDPSCETRRAIIEEAWSSATTDLLPTTIELIELVDRVSQRGLSVDVVAAQYRMISNCFGDVGFVAGVGRLSDLLSRFRKIAAAFEAGRTLKCSAPGTTSEECRSYEACVVDGNATDIFLNESFFDPSKSAERRAVSLIHEMAHSALGAGHGSSGDAVALDCSKPFETDYRDGRDNAYSYELLVSCANGLLEAVNLEGKVDKAKAAQPGAEPAFSLGASAGVGFGDSGGVDSDTARFVGALSGRYSFGAGEFMVFAPGIGFHLIYLSPSESDPHHVAAVTTEFAGRFHLPLAGTFVDVGGGGYAGVDIGEYTGRVEAEAGLSAFAGVGWQWRALQVGPEFRAHLPLTESGEPGMVVAGRFLVELP